MSIWYPRCLTCLRSLRTLVRPMYQETIFNTRRRLFLRSITLADDNMVRLIDQHGTTLGVVEKAEADRIAKKEGLVLTQVAKASESITNSVYKLLKPKIPAPKHPPSSSTRGGYKLSNKPRKPSEPGKELTMKSQIQDNDLNVKAKKLQEFLDRDLPVTLKIVKPRRVTVTPTDTYERLVAKLNCDVIVKGTPKSTETFFRATIVKKPGSDM